MSRLISFFFSLSLSPTSIFAFNFRPFSNSQFNKKLLLCEATLFYYTTTVLQSFNSTSFCSQTGCCLPSSAFAGLLAFRLCLSESMSCLNCIEDLLIFCILGDYQIQVTSMKQNYYQPNNFFKMFVRLFTQMNLKYQYSRLICLILILALTTAQPCKPEDEEFFVSFHPHLDAFWLNTDDQLKDINFRPAGFLYAMNQRNSKTIFNSMYSALEGDSKRKYFITEIVFFKDWYQFISNDMKTKVRQFVSNGQLQIANGGWVENDQAVCYVDDIIDQYTIGHQFLRQNFGIQTKIGWATDSFGHSHSQAAIEHLLGFQAQGIQRIDDRYIYKRKNGSLLQFYWSAVSDSNGRKYGGVYTHIRHYLHEFVDYRAESTDSLVRDYQGVNTIMSKLYKRKKYFRFLGNDFEQFIPSQFTALQRLFNKLNSQGNNQNCPKFKYGNPTDYINTLKAQQQPARVRQSDFIPNFDQDHYWTGYFTTNPLLKIVCKDFSRLTNLFRKIYIKNRISRGSEDQSLKNLLVQADELLSVMQHHDGITATSKLHIEELFRQRMTKTSQEIINAITNIQKMPEVRCIYSSNKRNCNIQALSDNKEIFLTILHQGAKKSERIEIQMPKGKYFEAESDTQDSIYCNQVNACILVFEAVLKPGKNVIKLNKITDNNAGIIYQNFQQSGPQFSNDLFTVQITESTIKYTLKNAEYIHISLTRSENTVSIVETQTWNKYGQSIKKSQRKIPGIYIMANNGRLSNFIQSRFNSLRVIQGKKYIKVWAFNQLGHIEITVSKNQLTILDLETVFKPAGYMMFDYFLRISSQIKGNNQFYHDMNGYLVSKRKINYRLDYEWNYSDADKINSNTYPMCSFGYTTNGIKKMVVFTDRPQGFTTYDEDLLINIDRLTGDDYKGVGEGYTKQITNNFKHRIAIVPENQNHQRLWQRSYDQYTLGFLSASGRNTATLNQADQNYKWVKYTTFSLNKNQFVIRLYNLNDNKNVKVAKFLSNSWDLPELGLQLKFADIKETYANGNPITKRKVWTLIADQITVQSAGQNDSQTQIVLQPLQIRTFRINLSEVIPFESLNSKINHPQQHQISQAEPKTPKQHFIRRCF